VRLSARKALEQVEGQPKAPDFGVTDRNSGEFRYLSQPPEALKTTQYGRISVTRNDSLGAVHRRIEPDNRADLT
jgi:hypothetical protein